MEKEQGKSTTGMEKQRSPVPATDGIVVVLVKKLLSLNFLKSGIKKDF